MLRTKPGPREERGVLAVVMVNFYDTHEVGFLFQTSIITYYTGSMLNGEAAPRDHVSECPKDLIRVLRDRGQVLCSFDLKLRQEGEHSGIWE